MRKMTAARRRALRKAQLASARKRKGKSKKPMSRRRRVAYAVGAIAAVNAGALAMQYGPSMINQYQYKKNIRSIARANVSLRKADYALYDFSRADIRGAARTRMLFRNRPSYRRR